MQVRIYRGDETIRLPCHLRKRKPFRHAFWMRGHEGYGPILECRNCFWYIKLLELGREAAQLWESLPKEVTSVRDIWAGPNRVREGQSLRRVVVLDLPNSPVYASYDYVGDGWSLVMREYDRAQYYRREE